jgi:hypothetical protein
VTRHVHDWRIVIDRQRGWETIRGWRCECGDFSATHPRVRERMFDPRANALAVVRRYQPEPPTVIEMVLATLLMMWRKLRS